MSVHMLGCAWVTRSEGGKCVIFESEAGALEKKHDMTQFLPRFLPNTPQKLPMTPLFSPLPGTSADPGGLAGGVTAGSRAPVDSCCLSRNWLQLPLAHPQPPQRLHAGKHKPETHVAKLVLGADRILNKHERQHLNTRCCDFFFLSAQTFKVDPGGLDQARRASPRFLRGEHLFQFYECMSAGDNLTPSRPHSERWHSRLSLTAFWSFCQASDAELCSYLRCTREKVCLCLAVFCIDPTNESILAKRNTFYALVKH